MSLSHEPPVLAPSMAVPDTADVSRASRGRARDVTWRRLAAYAFAAALLGLAQPRSGPLWPAAFAAGAALALAGEALRVWGCGHLRKNQDVVTSGPYARVRNPLYLGTLLILVGVCLAAGQPVVLFGLLPAGLAAFFVYYTPKKERIESDRLRRRFGRRYDRYHAAVPGYLPRLTRWEKASKARWSGALVVENSEVETVLFVLSGLAVLAVRAFV